MADLAKLLTKIRAQLIMDQPFFGLLLSSIKLVPEKNYPTCATDGYVIYYNETYFNSITPQEIRALLLHEVLHIIYLHCSNTRRKNRDPAEWSKAIDYAINLELKDAKYQLPQNALIDHAYREKTAEQIYDDLSTNKPKTAPGQGLLDSHIWMATDETREEEVRDRVIGAYEATKEVGTIPGGVEQYIKLLRKNKVAWQRVFARYVGSALSQDDYSFAKPNRRYLPQDLILPSLYSQKVGSIVVARDTSGSVTDEDQDQLFAEIVKMSSLVGEITVIDCDTIVQQVTTVRSAHGLRDVAKIHGRGGTSFVPPFIEVEKRRLAPEIFIYLTDGYGEGPKKPPPYPVLWILTTADSKRPTEWGTAVWLDTGR